MFKALASLFVFLLIIIIDIYVCQDFEPKYLIMIIPMTLVIGVITWTNIISYIESIVIRKNNKKQQKNNTHK